MHLEEIKAALRMKEVTLASLADELGVSRSSVSHVISGRAQSARVAGRIAKILGKSVSEIWPPKPQSKLRRTPEQVAAQRAAAIAG